MLSLFVAGTLLLVIVQYNSSRNIESLISGNEKLLKELRASNHLRELERDIIWVESRIRAAIATDDISHIEGVDEKIEEIEAYLDSLKGSNSDLKAERYINRLDELAKDKLRTKDALVREFEKSGHMDDTSVISNPRARVVSNEITLYTRRIYDSRQRLMIDLSKSVEDSGRNARLWGSVMIMLIVCSACSWFWFIIGRIKQQNRLILQLDASEKKAREAALVKENFMANMSHEIRTPLNSILGFTNLLKTRKLETEPREFVSAIQKAGENLLTIINDILDLSKIEAGMMRIENNVFSIRGLVHSIQTLFAERVREKQLQLIAEIDEEVPDTLIGDATRLTQIFVNLIGNAIKFTEKGHILIHIYSKQREGDVMEMGVAVSDTGIGIDKGKVNGIFDRFHQAEDSTTRNYGGTGLGLSIVKDLLVLQHGDIEVDSQPGQGTTFRFHIPYHVSDEQVHTILTDKGVNLQNRYNAAEIRLLVVDDNEMNQSLMKHLLNDWNLSYDIAGDGSTALELLKAKHYDMVLMDIQMPVMDGYTTTQYIRQQLLMDIPVIAMTAHALAGEREKCLSHGMNEYLSKPINEQQLYNFILKFTGKAETPKAELQQALKKTDYELINLDYMKQISKGNLKYEKKVTGQFLEMIPKAMLKLETALQEHDFKAINYLAHDLKTSVAILGLNIRLEEILNMLESTDDLAVAAEKIAALRLICDGALLEAAHFYASLPQLD